MKLLKFLKLMLLEIIRTISIEIEKESTTIKHSNFNNRTYKYTYK